MGETGLKTQHLYSRPIVMGEGGQRDILRPIVIPCIYIGLVDFHLYLYNSKIVRTLRNDVIGMIKSSLGKVLSPFRSHSESNGPGHC